ncbi:MAG: M43 family zinc metalloprotease, partial [Planctomycetota bacterium]
PTTGITYSNNTSWFNDNGSYWNQLAWDTSRYMNIYTNNAGGALGYVPDLPQGGIVGSNEDRVVILWSAFGRNAPIGPPFNQGRTLTHEVGHYLGREHTFNGGCGSASACYTSGDLICDTTPQSSPTDGCSGSSCGSPDPIHNYMDYSDDLCMWEFTAEQARRMRCTLEHYRPQLYEVDGAAPGACCLDSACTTTIQADCLAAGGSFLGAGSSCAGEPCSPATGACCATDGSCTITTSSACAGSGGAFQGAGSGCAAACAAPTGACCSGSGTCSVTTSDDCLAGGGSYLGDATSCSPSACGGDGTCGGPGAGDCQSANGTPGCDDAGCCETVCADDPFCCDVEWDAICAEQAAASCGGGGGCGSPDAGDCFAANGTPACADAACCETVCQADPFCCDVEWDSVCADGAAELCGDGGGDDGPCGDPGAGDCLAANGTPGCADADCCGVVCGLDPFCCETEWDALCAEQAADECGGDPATCVGDVTGDGLVNVDDLLDLLLDWGASGGPADLDGDGIVGVDDAILLLVNWGPCP